MPLLSVITVNKNNAAGLEKTIKSVAAQTYTDKEMLVIDGGSTDESNNVINLYKNTIDYFVSEPDGGFYDGMNKGIKKANGKFFMFLNSGDFLLDENVLAQAFDIIAAHQAEIYYGDIKIKTDDGFETIKMTSKPELVYWKKNNINHQAILYTGSLFKEIGDYNTHYRLAADQEFNIRACIMGKKFFHLDLPMVFYDVSGESSRHFEEYKNEVVLAYHELVPPGIQQIVDEHYKLKSLLGQRIMKGAMKLNKLYHYFRKTKAQSKK